MVARLLPSVLLALVAFASAASATASVPAPRLVVLGDSLTAGYGLSPEEAYPARLQEFVDAEGWRWEVVNAGLSGETTAGGLRRLAWVLRRPADIVVIALGGNDGLRGLAPSATRDNLAALVDVARTRAPGALVVLLGMRAPPNLGAEYGAAFDAAFATVAADTGVPLLPFLLEGVAGDAELNQADGIHPTAEGQARIAAHVWTFLRPLLAERAEAR